VFRVPYQDLPVTRSLGQVYAFGRTAEDIAIEEKRVGGDNGFDGRRTFSVFAFVLCLLPSLR